MKRIVFLGYGIVCYLMFQVVYTCLACFVENFALPKTIDSVPVASDAAAVAGSTTWGAAVAIDVVLLLLFGLQHSVMARPWFKQAWTKIVPQEIERSTYVLISNLTLLLMMWQWRAIPLVVWDVPGTAVRVLLIAISVVGWLIVPTVSLMINHFDLFGVRQVWLQWRGRKYSSLPFGVPMLYRYMRHPLYVGFALALWATPTMTVGHLLMAGVLTGYMVLASKIEERDLVNHFGALYADYRRQVPAFVPRIMGKKDRRQQTAQW
ncbi:MAG TPA: NnrU family protein [Pirellulales bacterium]|nr:NnrU family protein [Pirellulales bacterium]